jgi:hypothetical protein
LRDTSRLAFGIGRIDQAFLGTPFAESWRVQEDYYVLNVRKDALRNAAGVDGTWPDR